MRNRVILAYGITVILWASAFPGIKAGLQSYSPEHLATLRLLIAAFALILFGLITKMKLPEVKDIPVIMLLGFLGFTVYHTALSFGEETISAGAASLIVSTAPIFSAALSAIFLKVGFSKMGWVGTIVAFFGVALISLGTGDELSIMELGALFVLLAAFSESFYFVFQTHYLQKYGFLPFTAYTIIAGSLFMLFFIPGLGEEIAHASIGSTISVVYLGIFPTVIPYFAIAYATSIVGAAEATSALYLTPAFAIFISWIWIGEIPTILSLIGGVITLIGVGITNLKGNKDLKK
ncbi:DMT family transporter [Virgibacillus sp. W0181]|uniref:DMT family transporter n=1 Tax=Virgibacillus sp. W0181 TaxID=3391581 RepID=UPI003F479EEF